MLVGTWCNAISQFNASRPGLTFENQPLNARTLEVSYYFLASSSGISDDMDANGPCASLILADQNEITVNGGCFVNFERVALMIKNETAR